MLRLITVACLLVAIQGAALPKNQLDFLRRHRNTLKIFPDGKIVGGAPISLDQVPWQGALEDGGYLFCGASIISRNYILTAAHCTDGTPARYITVRTGTDRLESGGTVTQVASIAQNPGFNQNELDYDVSVLRLSTPLNLGGNQLAVVLASTEPAAGTAVRVTGWGTLSEGGSSLPSNLQAVTVNIVARNTCNSDYGGGITARMICAGTQGKDSCQGDSGGALTADNVQVGIVSWGYGCARAGYPGVYTNVASLKSYIQTNSNNEAQFN